MAKTPKVAKNIESEKQPKIAADPGIYKNSNISWQISKIDPEGIWGLQSLNPTHHFNADQAVSKLKEADEKLLDTIIKCDGKSFNSQNEFLTNIQKNCGGNITALQQLNLLESLSESSLFWVEIYPKLKIYEALNWHELERELYGQHTRKTKHHAVQVDKLAPEAIERLKKLKLDDLEELYSLRLTGKIRVWGIRKFGFLQLLWFDFEHAVCPSLRD